MEKNGPTIFHNEASLRNVGIGCEEEGAVSFL